MVWRLIALVVLVVVAAILVVGYEPYYGASAARAIGAGVDDKVLVQYAYKDRYECEKDCAVMGLRTQ